MSNPISLDRLCAALADAIGVDAPAQAAAPDERLTAYVADTLKGKKADRLFMYNPDAIAQWIYEKYPHLLAGATASCDLALPFCTVMPSVTPVCFGTMYTGAQPAVHGIRKYEKPIIAIESLFDAAIRAGKKCAIVAEKDCSLSMIYLGKEMDYFIYDTIGEVNAKACELILQDAYDFIVVYNGNYDAVMHRNGPESIAALGEARANDEAFTIFNNLIRQHWKSHNTLVGFAMDHGCHEIDGNLGSHGLDMDEDLNIVHLYKSYPKCDGEKNGKE